MLYSGPRTEDNFELIARIDCINPSEWQYKSEGKYLVKESGVM
jgi:hypothetical protein